MDNNIKWNKQIHIREINDAETISNEIFVQKNSDNLPILRKKNEKKDMTFFLIVLFSYYILVGLVVLFVASNKATNIEDKQIKLNTQIIIPIDSSLEGAPDTLKLQQHNNIDDGKANILK